VIASFVQSTHGKVRMKARYFSSRSGPRLGLLRLFGIGFVRFTP
jgi:hypothetical protein